jgi:hypothetical protein
LQSFLRLVIQFFVIPGNILPSAIGFYKRQIVLEVPRDDLIGNFL